MTLLRQNFSYHIGAAARQTAGMTIEQSSQLLYVDVGLSCDTFNIIHILGNAVELKAQLSLAVAHFRKKSCDFCVWISDELLTAEVKGILTSLDLTQQADQVGMIKPLAAEVVPTTINEPIEVIRTLQQLETAADIIAHNWQPPDKDVYQYFERTKTVYLADPNLTLLLYYNSGKAVATVELCQTGDTIGVYNLATLAAYRQQGLGSKLMQYAEQWAMQRACKQMVLQAGSMSYGIFQRQDFLPIERYFEYS